MKLPKLALAVVFPPALCAASPARAVEAPTLKGKTVEVLIAFEAGGPYDLYARLLARRLGAHLPGAPAVVVRNLPGAGGMVGANYLFNASPRDGTSIGVLSQTLAIGQALGVAPGLKYDVEKLGWLGRMTSNVELQHSLTRFGFTNFDIARQSEVVVAGTGPTSSSVVFPKLLNQVIGTKFKLVTGYPGPRSAELAMERGEVAAIVKPWSSLKATEADRLKNREITPIMQYTRERWRELPDTPAVVDVARDAEERELFGLFASGGALGTSIAAPPGLDADMVEMWRGAVAATMASPELRADAAAANMDLDFLDGAGVAKIAADTFAISPGALARARKFAEDIARQ